MSKTMLFLSAAVTICVASGLVVLFSGPKSYTQIRIAVPALPGSALIILAADRGFFREHGIDVELVYRSTGKECVELLTAKQVDLAQAYTTPIVRSLLSGQKFAIFTELHHSERATGLVVRRDHGIGSVAALAGKSIGVPRGTNVEFMLRQLLSAHLVNVEAVAIKWLSVHEIIAKLTAGELDAGGLWEPYLSATVFNDEAKYGRLFSSNYSEFSALVGLHAAPKLSQDLLERTIAGILDAEAFYGADPRRAQAKVAKILTQKQGVPDMPAVWGHIQVRTGLSATFLAMLSEETTWAKVQVSLPAFYNPMSVLNGAPLERLRPAMVTYK